MFTKDEYILDAERAGVKPNEVDFRFAAFEAMSLSFCGKQEEVDEKLKEMNNFYSKLKESEVIIPAKLTFTQKIKKFLGFLWTNYQ